MLPQKPITYKLNHLNSKVIKQIGWTYGEYVNAAAGELATGHDATLYINDEFFIGPSLSGPDQNAQQNIYLLTLVSRNAH